MGRLAARMPERVKFMSFRHLDGFMPGLDSLFARVGEEWLCFSMRAPWQSLLLWLAPFTAIAAAPVLDNRASPHAQVHTVGLDEVRWTNGFWADRFELCRTRMLPAMGQLMEGTNYTQFFRN